MENIKFDEGYKELSLNGDENRVIRFKATDYTNILKRFAKSQEKINKAMDLLKDEKDVAVALNKAEELLKNEIDNIIGSKVSEVVFKDVSPLAISKGKYIFENFLIAIIEYCKTEIEKEQNTLKESHANLERYKEEINELPKEVK